MAKQTVKALWSLQNKDMRLLVNVVNIQTDHWIGKQSDLGAELDLFFEYLLKSYILFQERKT